MAKDTEEEQPILPPKTKHPVDRVRAVANGLVGLAPGGGLVTALLDDFVPKEAEKARDAWQGSITERTNQHGEKIAHHEAQLNPKKKIDGSAALLATNLAQNCPDGLGRLNYEPENIHLNIPLTVFSRRPAANDPLRAIGRDHKRFGNHF